MKKIYLLSFLSLAFTNFSQAQVTLSEANGQYVYTEKFTVEPTSSDDLKERAWQWCAQRYRFAKEVSKKERRSSERIVTNARHEIQLPSSTGPRAVQMFYTLEIAFEESGYRYQVSNVRFRTYDDPLLKESSDIFTVEMMLGKPGEEVSKAANPLVQLYMDATHTYFDHLLTHLKSSINRPPVVLAKN